MKERTALISPKLDERHSLPQNKSVFAIRTLVASTLLLAVATRTFWPTETALLVAGYGIPSWTLLVIAQIEILLACLLIAGVLPQITVKLTGVLFLIFILFSLYRAISGEESCGCFGALTVSPWVTLILNSLCLVGLYSLSSRHHARIPKGRTVPALTAYFLIAFSSLAWPAFASSDPTLETLVEGPGVSHLQGMILLEPEQWVGQPFPLTNSLKSDQELPSIDQDNWIILFHHHDCPKCNESRPRYASLGQTKENILLVEVPPFGSTGSLKVTDCLTANLSADQEWFIQAPIEVRLKNGIVDSASQELPAIKQSMAH